jgi:hypothetical protein
MPRKRRFNIPDHDSDIKVVLGFGILEYGPVKYNSLHQGPSCSKLNKHNPRLTQNSKQTSIRLVYKFGNISSAILSESV